MKIISRFSLMFCLIFALFIALILVVSNPQIVTVTFMGYESSLNLGMLLSIFFSSGVILGLIGLVLVIATAKIKLSLKEKELLKLNESSKG